MTGGLLFDLYGRALVTAVMIAGPFVVAALVVGVLTSLFQAMTQLQDASLTFLPKVFAVGAVIAFGGHWVIGQLARYLIAAMDGVAAIGAGAP